MSAPRDRDDRHDDIAREYAEESRHRRYGGGKYSAPVWAWTSGTWAVVGLFFLVWGLVWALLLGLVALVPDLPGELITLLGLASFIPAFLIVVILWLRMGKEARNRVRAAVRWLPVVIFGLVVLGVATLLVISVRSGAIRLDRPPIKGPGWRVLANGGQLRRLNLYQAMVACEALGPGWRLGRRADLQARLTELRRLSADFWVDEPPSESGSLTLLRESRSPDVDPEFTQGGPYSASHAVMCVSDAASAAP